MRSILILIILLQTSLCFTQEQSPAEKLLNSGADLYNKGNYAQAITLLEQSVRTSKQSGEQQILGKAYNNLGNAYSQIGKSEQAPTELWPMETR